MNGIINKIIFRVNANQTIGLGHVMRSLALADMLFDKFKITFACHKLENQVLNLLAQKNFEVIELPITNDYETDAKNLLKYLDKNTILVLDGYHFKEAYQLNVKPHCHKLVCIDDIHNYHFYADVIINHCEHAKYIKYSCEPYTRLYLGGRYALLRKPFLENKNLKRDLKKSIENIFICMGGADTSNQTLRVVKALDLTSLYLTVNIVIGVANSNYQKISQWMGKNKNSKLNINLLSNLGAYEMCEQLMQNDFLFATASTTALEACCVGIPMLVGITADNQIDIANILKSKRAALNIEWYKDSSIKKIKEKLLNLIDNKNLLKQFVINQKILIDGNSELRYKTIFAELSKANYE